MTSIKAPARVGPSGAVDAAGKDGSDDDTEDNVERRVVPEEAAITNPHDRNGSNIDDYCPGDHVSH
jgi:hypothetical protein